MKRKVLSLLLCVLLLAGLAYGCANKAAQKDPKDLFFEIADNMGKLEEIGFDATLNINIPQDSAPSSESLPGGISNAKISLAGSSSKRFKQFACEIVASVKGSQLEANMKVTDILVNESGIYLDLRSLFNVFGTVMGFGAPYDAMFSTDYLGITLEDLSAFTGMPMTELPSTDKANMPKTQELNAHMLKGLKESLKSEYFKAEDGFYTLTLNSANISELVNAFAKDMDVNAGIYADALLETEAQNPGYLYTLGLPSSDPSRDEVIAFIKEKASELSAQIEGTVNTDETSLLISLGKGKTDKSYDIRVSLTGIENNLDLKVDFSFAEIATTKIDPPTDFVTLDELLYLYLM